MSGIGFMAGHIQRLSHQCHGPRVDLERAAVLAPIALPGGRHVLRPLHFELFIGGRFKCLRYVHDTLPAPA